MRPVLLASLLALAAAPSAQTVDGVLDEWGAPLHTDPSGDGGAVDFGRLWGAGDARYLTLAVEVGGEIGLQDGNAITLFLDTDDDASTGRPVVGIGAEIEYTFGERSGTVRLPGQSLVNIGHAALGLVTAPTVTADRFEILLDRTATVGGAPVFSGPTVRVALVDGAAGDRVPDAGGVALALSDDAPARAPLDLGKRPGDTRFLSYNVLRDRITDPQYRGPFERILRAVDPDVVAFQEIYDSDASEIATLLESMLPGTAWSGVGVTGGDVMVLARGPSSLGDPVALCDDPTRPTSCNVIAGLSLGVGRTLHVASLHPPCCGNDDGRQAEFDRLAAHLRDGLQTGAIGPVVVAGDMNLVGDRRQVQTLLAGEIVDTARFGPGAPLQTGGMPLADAAPPTTGVPADVTWVNPASSFGPGRLDWIVYADETFDPGNGFALYTPALTPDELAAAGLLAGDTNVSDHLPLVQDLFVPGGASTGAAPDAGLGLAVSPNPARGAATVAFRLDRPAAVRVVLADALGRTVRVVDLGPQAAGRSAVPLDVSGLAAGVYVVRVEAGGRAVSRTLAVTR